MAPQKSGSLSLGAFERNVKEIIENLLERTEANIALLNIPPINWRRSNIWIKFFCY